MSSPTFPHAVFHPSHLIPLLHSPKAGPKGRKSLPPVAAPPAAANDGAASRQNLAAVKKELQGMIERLKAVVDGIDA